MESRLPGEISITSEMQMTPPYGRKQRRTKKPLDENKRMKKLTENLTFRKLRSWHPASLKSSPLAGGFFTVNTPWEASVRPAQTACIDNF